MASRYNTTVRHCSSRHGPSRCFSSLALLLGSWSLATSPAAAEQPLPSNPAPPSQTVVATRISERPATVLPAIAEPAKSSPAPHAFCDRTNRLLFSGIILFRGLDYASTRNMQARGREEILLPDDVVNNSAGFASLEAASTAASVGFSYWMHRTGHHRVERWISIVHIGASGFGVARNYALESKHLRP
jgi:hypothetical protein